MLVKSIKKRDITLKDFKKLSKCNDCFAAWRQVAKTVNFATLFGAGAATMAGMLEDNGFKESECDDYISLVGIQNDYNALLLKNKGKMVPKKVKYLCCATKMLDTYYKTYPGVQKRTDRELAFSRLHGYVRTWHGPVRHLPELRYVKYDSRGFLTGADKVLYSRTISHIEKQGGNSPIQTMEARISFGTQACVAGYLREWGLKSRLWNSVHDSVDVYVYKPELEIVMAMMSACASWVREPYYDISMCMDFAIADPSKGNEHNYYKGGTEDISPIPIDEAVSNWNKEHPDHQIKWHGCWI